MKKPFGTISLSLFLLSVQKVPWRDTKLPESLQVLRCRSMLGSMWVYLWLWWWSGWGLSITSMDISSFWLRRWQDLRAGDLTVVFRPHRETGLHMPRLKNRRLPFRSLPLVWHDQEPAGKQTAPILCYCWEHTEFNISSLSSCRRKGTSLDWIP